MINILSDILGIDISVTNMMSMTKILNKEVENDIDKDVVENLEKLIVNVLNSIIITEKDIKNISKDEFDDYIMSVKHTKRLIDVILDKNTKRLIQLSRTLPTDNYDSMSKEELIAILRNKV